MTDQQKEIEEKAKDYFSFFTYALEFNTGYDF